MRCLRNVVTVAELLLLISISSDDIVRKSEFFRLKGDICDPAGCLSELCIQLAIIMVGKQFWNNCMEYLFP